MYSAINIYKYAIGAEQHYKKDKLPTIVIFLLLSLKIIYGFE